MAEKIGHINIARSIFLASKISIGSVLNFLAVQFSFLGDIYQKLNVIWGDGVDINISQIDFYSRIQ